MAAFQGGQPGGAVDLHGLGEVGLVSGGPFERGAGENRLDTGGELAGREDQAINRHVSHLVCGGWPVRMVSRVRAMPVWPVRNPLS